MRYSVVAMPGGYAVAYPHVNLGLVAVWEGPTRPAAEAEADRLERNYQAQLAAQALSIARMREHAMRPKRPVRWFPNDAFA
ncbi:hypothetical protein AVHY2522_22870 [Acidovorax sp. SUPP2522]|uniref:hypothetical protein n=1 Tax=unclassified Acidovorax TaxID=2684926 RepID=UPI00234B0960|nr:MULTISPECIES: hypothetical protein [unclassified Acidovorax]WCM95730.1 hypothetical protein M5C96_14705 [Acidovorax sp. GBBC 1281]GKT19547.1 hypothetical protein AVHY2522_22870 [Acidovorax sp. SUPP2522]